MTTKVRKGQVTFDAEGNDIETSKYFSRVILFLESQSGEDTIWVTARKLSYARHDEGWSYI